MVVGLAAVKIFRLWLSVLPWLKFSGYGFGVLFFVFFVRWWSLVFSLAEMFRLWSLVLFSIFLVLLFRLYQAIVCGLVSSVVLLYVALSGCGLWSCSLSLSVLSGGVVLWSYFFVWLWSLFWSCFRLIFGYGYAVAEALRLWFLVLFLLSLLDGVVALLRTRLLFVYFLFRLLSVSSIFSCGVFLACAFCLCQVVRVELPVFSVEVVTIFRLCF